MYRTNTPPPAPPQGYELIIAPGDGFTSPVVSRPYRWKWLAYLMAFLWRLTHPYGMLFVWENATRPSAYEDVERRDRCGEKERTPMSERWEVYCLDCKDSHDLPYSNHQPEVARHVIKYAKALSALAPIQDTLGRTGLSVGIEGNPVCLEWLTKHADHRLVPRNEYGVCNDECGEYFDCRTCEHRQACHRKRGHEGPHSNKREGDKSEEEKPPMPPAMVVEVWKVEDGYCVLPKGRDEELRKVALENDSVPEKLREISGKDWDDCMRQHYEIMGWGNYVPSPPPRMHLDHGPPHVYREVWTPSGTICECEFDDTGGATV